ncbi:secreted RxLR effector protein 161-like [Miscanthus floridulus]|uniref:secreted RxLR effector protein 161-like n=1 Tax=Miscanthus floridulus TaxID=154761 RepID=UPI00345AA38A
MEERLKLMKASIMAKVDATLYQSIVGSLHYLVHMRPDIAFTVDYVSCFMEDPQKDHRAVVKQLLHYVNWTVDHGIVFPKIGRSGLQLTMFSDADMARDIDGWWSTSGMLVFLGSAPISWLSLKQTVVALSTCKVEYVAVAIVACHAMWLCRLLGKLTGVEAHPLALMVDNQPAIAFSKNLVLHGWRKHIDVKFHILRDYVDGWQIVIEFIKTGRQLANVLTKPLGHPWFTKLKKMIDMVEVLGLAVGLREEM